MHCYDELAENPKWQDYDSERIAQEKTTTKGKGKKKAVTNDDDNAGEGSSTAFDRPIGKKAEKQKRASDFILEGIAKRLAKDDEGDNLMAEAIREQNQIKREKNEREIMFKKESDLGDDELAIEYLRLNKQKIIQRLRKEVDEEYRL